MWRFLAFLAWLPAAALADPLPVVDFLFITRHAAHGQQCAITFDDGPGDHTARMLDILLEQQIPATFFVLGTQVRRNPDLIRRMLVEGHEIANHSFSHPKMRRLTEEQQSQELRQTLDLLRPLGARPKYFRPPYGNYDARTVDVAAQLGMRVILWSHDSQDWRYHSLASLEGSVLPQKTRQQIGGVYLFHDTHSNTVSAMPSILNELRTKGCQFVTVSQWIDSHPVDRPDPELLATSTQPLVP